MSTPSHVHGVSSEHDRTIERSRVLLERVPVITWEADPLTWQFTFVSNQAQTITGHPPQKWMEKNFWPDHIHPDDRESAVAFCVRSTDAGEAHDFEYRFIRADGSVMWIRDMVSVETHNGRPVRLYGVMIDITDRKAAEDALRRSNAEHESLIEALAEGVMMVDRQGVIRSCNAAGERILGIAPGQAIGISVTDRNWQTFREDGNAFAIEEYPAVVTCRTGEPLTGVVMGVRRPCGRTAWISINTRKVAVPGEPPPYIVVVSFSDVTEQKEAEQRQRLLMRELDHRVKNNLASVLSIAEQTAEGAASLAEFRAAFTARIAAMARAHEALAAARWEAVDLHDAARVVLGPFAQERPQRILLQGSSVRIDAPIAVPLALALHELLTNAVKYGALSNTQGLVALSWTSSNGRLLLEWREQDGPSISAQTRPGMGTRLIEGLIRYQLHGTVNMRHEPSGTRCQISIPLHEQGGSSQHKTTPNMAAD